MTSRSTNRTRFIVDGYIYHNNVIAGTPPLRYLGCAEKKRRGCRGRAAIPVDGTLDQLKVTQLHNHPPDVTATEKVTFMNELQKSACDIAMEQLTLKKVYENVAKSFPRAAEEITFKSIDSSMHRWRKHSQMFNKMTQ